MDAPRKRLGDIFYDSFFQYVGVVTGFATGLEVLTVNIPIQNDANFLCVSTEYEDGQLASGLAAAPNKPSLLNGGILVQLTDGASQRALSSLPVPVTDLFGSAQRPFLWPLTHLFRANSLIGIQATGQGVGPPTVVGATFRLVFSGFKVPVGSVPGTTL
jgi:hypothetical protein